MSTNWQAQFVGRETELNQLKQDWEKVKQGKPQLRLILGDTGLGKTRLIQAFYSEISQDQAHDPDQYWPDNLGKDGSSLNINPQFEEDYILSDKKLPWLWWGIRYIDPSRNNQQKTNVLLEGLETLKPHIVALQKAKEQRSNIKDTIIALATTTGAVLGLGGFAELFATASTTLGLSKDSHAIWKNWGKDKQQQQTERFGDYQHKQQKNRAEQLEAYFSALLDRNQKDISGSIPIILVIDDAQWAKDDGDILKLIESLYSKACNHHFPLYLLVTHWHNEWQSQQATIKSVAGETPESFAHLIRRNPVAFRHWKMPEPLPPLADEALRKVVKTALPGLTPAQQDKILHRVKGNAGFCHDLLLLLKTEKARLFIDRDINKALTARGEKLLGELSNLNHYQVNQRRFGKLQSDIKDLLAWSSYQGLDFLENLSLKIAEKYACPLSKAGFDEAETPHTIIKRLNQVLSEFTQSSLQEIAYTELCEVEDLEDESCDFIQRWRQLLKDDFATEQWQEYPPPQQEKYLRLLLTEAQAEQDSPLIRRVFIALSRLYANNEQGKELAEVGKELVAARPAAGWGDLLVENDYWRIAQGLLDFSWFDGQ